MSHMVVHTCSPSIWAHQFKASLIYLAISQRCIVRPCVKTSRQTDNLEM